MQQERSDVFSISMIELLLIIMFSLLIVMVLLNSNLQKKQAVLDDLRGKIHSVDDDLHKVHEKLGLEHREYEQPLDLNEAVAQLQQFAEELNTSFSTPEADNILARMKIDDVWTSLTRLTDNNFDMIDLIKKLEEIKSEVKELKKDNQNKIKMIEDQQVREDQLNNELAVLQEINEHKDDVKALIEEYREREEGFKEEIARTREKNNSLKNQVKYLAGTGLVHPPCWSDPETGKIEYTFKVVVTDNDVYIKNIFPEYRNKEYLSITNHKDYDDVSMSFDRFRREMQVFLKHAKAQTPECRYFSIIQDKTSANSKSEWKRGLKSVESSFYKLEI
ncbi:MULTISPECIES: hypothetical protein [unclassified Endozoicomonas]|uniref:hypothetical protein n=1 Tax=unclassified Endozoicomonas TaxID=2644528 RepID=UPI003BB6ED5D